MNICGIEIKGSEAIIAVASLDGSALSHVALNTKKIALDDDDEAANVKALRRAGRVVCAREFHRPDCDQEAQQEG